MWSRAEKGGGKRSRWRDEALQGNSDGGKKGTLMGDRYISYYPCPKCGREIEEYDAPSCTMFCASCDYCDWKDLRDYFEVLLEEEGEPLGCIAWASEHYAHIGPMTKEEFAGKYPKRFSWWKDNVEMQLNTEE